MMYNDSVSGRNGLKSILFFGIELKLSCLYRRSIIEITNMLIFLNVSLRKFKTIGRFYTLATIAHFAKLRTFDPLELG